MSDCTVQVTPLVLASTAATLPPAVTFHYRSETIRVRELIRRVVTAQIQILHEQRTHSLCEIQEILARQYLAGMEVEELAAEGAVKMPTAPDFRAPDLEQEVERALAGFEQGRFFITVNGYQPDSLDDMLLLSEFSKVLFLRLTPLVGG